MAKKRKKKSAGKKAIIALIIIAVLIAAGYFGVQHLKQKKIVAKPKAILEEELPTIASKDSKFYDAYKKSDKLNVLILGVNSNLTDTIMLMSYDRKKDHIDVISIPRDTEYHRDGFDSPAERKINAAYKRNPLNTAKAVNDILMGMPINYYAVVDFKTIEEVVDAIDGVPVNLPAPMKYRDPKDKPPLVIDLPAGEQVLNGKQAVGYLRYRKGYSDGDIGRIKAQQEFIKAALDKAIGFKLPKVMKIALKTLDTDMTIGVAMDLALKAGKMKEGEMTTHLLPGIPPTKAPWYWTPDNDKIEEMIKEIYGIKDDKNTENEDGKAKSGQQETRQ